MNTTRMESGRRFGRYEVLGPLGRGGMGEVWRAIDTTLGREVALKVLPDEFAADRDRLARFEREAKLLASLNHPNIVTIHTVEESGGLRFLTMELVEGATLDQLLGRGALPVERFFELALLLADALATAHDRGVIHRDLKPGNVMVTPDGRLKVLDFGLAARSAIEGPSPEARTETKPLTVHGAIVGTVPYMSPEQLKGLPADQRSDIYALGAVLYEMATGTRPVAGEGTAELISSILRDTPRSVTEIRPELPSALAAALARCLDKDPARRFGSVRELASALEAARSGSGERDKAGQCSVAVLPFADMSPERDQEYFCDGMAEEILNSLSRIKRLRLASRTSSFRFKNAGADCRSIGRELGVSNLLEGSVRKAGDRLRISVQLIGCDDDVQLWSERYDRTLDDIFAIQEDIAHSVTQALRLTLTPSESSALQAAAADDAKAYDYYLRGRQLFYKGSRHDHGQARQMFARAIEIDPDYGRAYAGLADACAYIYKHFDHDPAFLEEAEVASRKALDLDPERAESRTSRGIVLWLSGRHSEAEREFEAAMRLDDTLFDAPYLYGIFSIHLAAYEKAAGLFQRAWKLRPDDYQSALLIGSMLRGAGRTQEAKAAFANGIDVARSYLAINPDESRAWYLGAIALAFNGEIETALEWADRALAIDPENSLLQYNICGVYGTAGLLDEAVGYMEEAVRLGFEHVESMETDPDLEPVRHHPRFRKLIDELRAR